MFTHKTTVTIDGKGRVVIPVKVREDLNLRQGDLLVLEYQDGIIQIFVWDKEESNK